MIILGCGTGRCGTVTFSELLNRQSGCVSTHENPPIVDITLWGQTKLKNLKQVTSRYSEFKADTAMWWIYFTKQLMSFKHLGDDLRMVCVERDKQEMIESYLKKTVRVGGNHWCVDTVEDEWDIAYPTYQTRNKRKALGMYWDDYHQLAVQYEQQYPDRFMLIKTEDLNNEEKMIEVLKFCGFSNPIFDAIHENKSK